VYKIAGLAVPDFSVLFIPDPLAASYSVPAWIKRAETECAVQYCSAWHHMTWEILTISENTMTSCEIELAFKTSSCPLIHYIAPTCTLNIIWDCADFDNLNHRY